MANTIELVIKKEIENQGGAISFRDFMEMCLYYPKQGYYQRNLQRTGKAGDFYTSPLVSDVFGKVAAEYVRKMWKSFGCPRKFFIIEYGAGNGDFARAILQKVSEYPDMHARIRYTIIEISDDFRKKQAICLKDYDPIWIDHIEDLGELEYACVLANEFLDALPVHWVVFENNTLMERFVTYNEVKQTFEFVLREADEQLKDYFLEQSVTLQEGQQAEVNLAAKQWLEQCSRYIKNGYIVTIDYGYMKDELYAPHRHFGTLLCYYRHTCNVNPLVRIGDQDITSHVNFSQLIKWGEEVNFECVSYANQSKFLLDGGIMDYWILDGTLSPFDADYKKNAAIKQLVMEQGMGNTFQVLIQKKNLSDINKGTSLVT